MQPALEEKKEEGKRPTFGWGAKREEKKDDKNEEGGWTRGGALKKEEKKDDSAFTEAPGPKRFTNSKKEPEGSKGGWRS